MLLKTCLIYELELVHDDAPHNSGLIIFPSGHCPGEGYSDYPVYSTEGSNA